MNTAINTIIFDAGGVLFEAKTGRGQRIKRLLQCRGYDDPTIDHAINLGSAFAKEAEKQGRWLTDWHDEKQYWSDFYDAVMSGLPAGNPTLKEELFHLTLYVNHCELFPEVKSVLEQLHGHYKLGVISNAYPSMDWIFDLLQIRKYFEHITISAAVHTYKPNRDIYDYSLAHLLVKPEQCLFIDDQERNAAAATRLGMKGVWLNRKAGHDLTIVYNELPQT